jgi:hypothetical protein
VRRAVFRWSIIIVILTAFVWGPFAYLAIRQSVREHQRRAEVKRNLDSLGKALDRYHQTMKEKRNSDH